MTTGRRSRTQLLQRMRSGSFGLFHRTQLNNRRRTALRGMTVNNQSRAAIRKVVSKNKAASKDERTKAKKIKTKPPARRIAPISNRAESRADNSSLAKNRVSRTARTVKAV